MIELNAAVEFTPEYAQADDVFSETVAALLDASTYAEAEDEPAAAGSLL